MCRPLLGVSQTSKELFKNLEFGKEADAVSQDLYHFIYRWHTAITNVSSPVAVLETLSDYIDSPSEDGINRTDINLAKFLASLITRYSTNETMIRSLRDVMIQVEDTNSVVDVAAMDIVSLQNSLGQTLGKTLTASLSEWNSSYFDSLAKNGALIDRLQLEGVPQLNKSLAQASAAQPFSIIGNPGNQTFNNTNRNLLSDDVTQNWDYEIRECNAGEPGGLADQVSHLLDTIHENLFLVMRETSRGKRSRYGFFQLFKTEKWIPIRRLYDHMYNAVGTRGNPAANQAVPDNRPTLICLQPDNRYTRSAYAVCAAEPRLRAFQQPGTPYAIGLCPAFWALPTNPVRAFCPYEGKVRDEYTGSALQLNQQSMIVYQMVRIYLGASVLDPEVFGLTEALKLNASEAYWNPSTWSYWYACEWVLFSFFPLYRYTARGWQKGY